LRKAATQVQKIGNLFLHFSALVVKEKALIEGKSMNYSVNSVNSWLWWWNWCGGARLTG
jgi:hypothetical protein